LWKRGLARETSHHDRNDSGSAFRRFKSNRAQDSLIQCMFRCMFACDGPAIYYDILQNRNVTQVFHAVHVMRICALTCGWLQSCKDWTQNPPGFGPWGFDPPSRHQYNQQFIKYSANVAKEPKTSGNQFGNHMFLQIVIAFSSTTGGLQLHEHSGGRSRPGISALSFRRPSCFRPDQDQHNQPQHNGDKGNEKIRPAG
jgi:hypothetical protein